LERIRSSDNSLKHSIGAAQLKGVELSSKHLSQQIAKASINAAHCIPSLCDKRIWEKMHLAPLAHGSKLAQVPANLHHAAFPGLPLPAPTKLRWEA
jgi:protein-tyrosine-phosphatase